MTLFPVTSWRAMAVFHDGEFNALGRGGGGLTCDKLESHPGESRHTPTG